MHIITGKAPKRFSIIVAYSKFPKLYGMVKLSTEEVMFQDRFGKIHEFGWWDLEVISADTGTQFKSRKFQDACQTHSVHFTLEAP